MIPPGGSAGTTIAVIALAAGGDAAHHLDQSCAVQGAVKAAVDVTIPEGGPIKMERQLAALGEKKLGLLISSSSSWNPRDQSRWTRNLTLQSRGFNVAILMRSESGRRTAHLTIRRQCLTDLKEEWHPY